MSAARDRLTSGYYNSQPKTVANPGGMDDGGHVINFPLAVADVGTAANEMIANNAATLAAVVQDNDATEASIALIGQSATQAAAAANGSKGDAAGSATAAGQAATAAANALTAAKRAVANTFPDRLDAVGAWFTEAATGDPAAVADPTAAAIVAVADYGFEYLKANAQGQLFAKGVLSASAGKFYEVEAEVEWTVKGGAETPAFTVGVQGLDAAFANVGGQVQAPLQAVGAIGVQTFKYRFGYAAPTGGAAWPSPGVSVWLRPYVLFNRKSDNSGAVTASTARVRRLTVRDVTGAVLGEIQAALAAASAASVSLADQAAAESGVGVGLMSATRVGQAIAAQALGVGATLESAANPGARFLKCDASIYLNSAYPALRAVLGPYTNPLVSRLSSDSGVRLFYVNNLWICWYYSFANGWQLATSPDLVTWSGRTNPFGTGDSGGGVAYGAGIYVVFGANGSKMYRSADLSAWTQIAFPSGFTKANAIARGANKFVVVGTKSSGNGAISSADGVGWTLVASSFNNQPWCVAYNPTNAIWIAGCSGGFVMRSLDDAVTWASVGSVTGGTIVGATVGAGQFAIIASGPSAALNGPDGQSWGAMGGLGGLFTGSPTSVGYDGAQFYIGLDNGRMLRAGASGWDVDDSATGLSGFGAIIRAGPNATDPWVVSHSAGLSSGRDQSTTQFQMPLIAASSSKTQMYMKAA